MDKYLKALRPAMVKILRKKYGEKEVAKRLKKTERLYYKWIREEGDLGGSENIMSSNIFLFYGTCAFYEAIDRDFTKEDFEILYYDTLAKTFKFMNRIDMNKLEKKKWLMKLAYKFLEKFKNKSDKKRGNEWGNTWKIRVNPNNRKRGIAFSLDSCPLYEFAQKHGYMDVLPLLCKSDHAIANAFHAKLIRHNILSDGDKTCEYWYVGDKSPEALRDKNSK
ncbi:MAG: L-2-amino-thiazoline-4-carboxylic acid hydrolase [Ruminococcus sp.]|nr:L-2-amino-thiazoline-4-carboxylic acid hydrolase [Ruminococcus sp.]MCM1480687.1 L-2-amino-thiazoline-4-carboxylic acid hydrolase [Muribaculaceae bacterium]